MNSSNSHSARAIKAAAAILLLHVNLALAAEPALQQAPASAAAQGNPDAPAPVTGATPATPPTLAQQMQQA